MDAGLVFSQEMITKALMKSEEGYDLLNILVHCFEDVEGDIKDIKSGVSEIKKDTEQINSKLDIILEKINGLESAFLDLKSESRDIDQKIILMSNKLDKIEKYVNEEDEEELEDYYALSQSLYDNWDELDELTRRLIPVAEYLYSKLQKYEKPDYSPVILELCRAIENEFLLKIFSKYTNDIIRRKGNNLEAFLATDRASNSLQKKTSTFVKQINKAVRTRRPEYTLGQMNTIMSIMNDSRTVNNSPLLQDFKEYLDNETIATDLLSVQYINKINDLVEKYRNLSAHPGFMNKDKAERCKEIMPERLDYLMDCVCTN